MGRTGRTEVKEEVLSRRSLAEIGLRNLASRILLRSLPAKMADAMAQFFSFEIKFSFSFSVLFFG